MSNELTTPEFLARQERAVLVAAAGCGKTHMIAESIKYTKGRQLILTHTHAGVHSLRNKLKKLNVNPNQYRVETIAGFALRYSISYPVTCAYQILNEDESIIYENLYSAAYNVIKNQTGRKIICTSYSGLFVDEYQDCTLEQHKLVLLLSELLPTRILGDSLQGIFDFRDQIVDWERDINPHFLNLPELLIPWRWENNNKVLGQWLLSVRNSIINEESISLQKSELPSKTYWYPQRCQISALKNWSNGNTVGIIKFGEKAHNIASKLGGMYNSMEEVERKNLIDSLSEFEKGKNREKILTLLKITFKCMTKVGSELKLIFQCVEKDTVFRGRKYQYLYIIIDTYIRTGNINLLSKILDYVGLIEDAKIYRKELWSDLKKLFVSLTLNPNESVISLARKQIEMYSNKGCRYIYNKTISRPFLIKGLEFNHAILLDADALKPKELYVSLTRGSNYLTILSKEQILKPRYI